MLLDVNAWWQWPRPVVVLVGGGIAGACDIVYACVFWWMKAGVSPVRILQSVAAGLLGPASFQGETGTAALGLALHFFIALTMAAVYDTAALRFPLLTERPVACGALFGLLAYGAMNYIVVPLSAAARGSSDPSWVALSVLVHAFLIGVPIALVAARAAR